MALHVIGRSANALILGLGATVAVMNQVTDIIPTALVDGLVERVEHEVGPKRPDTRQPTIRRAKTSITNAT